MVFERMTPTQFSQCLVIDISRSRTVTAYVGILSFFPLRALDQRASLERLLLWAHEVAKVSPDWRVGAPEDA